MKVNISNVIVRLESTTPDNSSGRQARKEKRNDVKLGINDAFVRKSNKANSTFSVSALYDLIKKRNARLANKATRKQQYHCAEHCKKDSETRRKSKKNAMLRRHQDIRLN